MTVMLPNRRMFWKVRAMPRAVIWSGRSPTSEWPSKGISPSSGDRCRSSVLKKVVLPAPFGPMMLTIWPFFEAEIHLVDGRQAAEAFGDAVWFQAGPCRTCLDSRRSRAVVGRSSLSASSALAPLGRDQAGRPVDHHQDQDQRRRACAGTWPDRAGWRGLFQAKLMIGMTASLWRSWLR